MTKALSHYNNVVAGGGNTVHGNKNIVIGNYNNIEGSNNWVFISSFTGKINRELLVGEWRIEMEKANLILINTRLAISFLNEAKNLQGKNKYSKNRQFVQWDKWTNPKNDRSDKHWAKYVGYKQWKTNWLSKVTSVVGKVTWGILGGLWRR